MDVSATTSQRHEEYNDVKKIRDQEGEKISFPQDPSPLFLTSYLLSLSSCLRAFVAYNHES